MLTTDQLPVEECLWYSVFLHASKISSLSELALDEQSFNAFYLTTFKYSSVWYFALPRDAKDFSKAFKMELVKFLHDGGTRSKIHSCTRAWLAQLFYIHGEYHDLSIVCGATIQSWHFLYLFFTRSLREDCDTWARRKCLGMSQSVFKYYLDQPLIAWTCYHCALPQLSNSFFLDGEELSVYGGAETQNSSLHTDHVGENHLAELTQRLWHSSPKDLKIAHLNVRGVRNKLKEIRYLQQFCKFEILAITQSHLDKYTVLDSALDIDGMKFLRLYRKGHKGGGCVLYYADHLKAIHRKDLYTPGLEAIWLQVKFTCTSALFAVLYRPPDDSEFFDSVRIPLEKAWLKTSNIFLLGDMNCNLSTVNYSAHGVANKYKLQSIMDDFHNYA